MGMYFNPPQELEKVGRELTPGKFEQLETQLRDGEILIGLYDRVMFMNAPHLYSEREYFAFENQRRQGIIIGKGFYAIKRELLYGESEES